MSEAQKAASQAKSFSDKLVSPQDRLVDNSTQ